MNCQKAPFNDVRVRQALNYAVDREAIIKGILKGVGSPALSITSPIVWGYYPVGKYHYDPERAKELLREAGYPTGFSTTLWTPQGRYFMDLDTAVAVQAQLAEVGVKADVKVIDWATYLSSLRKPLDESETEMYLLGWEVGTGDLGYLLDLVFHSSAWPPASWNTMFYKDVAVDVLIEAGRVTTNLEDRYEIYKGLQKLVVDDAPWIFLYIYQSVTGLRTDVHGLELLPIEVFTIKNVWKGPPAVKE
jgi:ABC-type transport system substrate-binding protein